MTVLAVLKYMVFVPVIDTVCGLPPVSYLPVCQSPQASVRRPVIVTAEDWRKITHVQEAFTETAKAAGRHRSMIDDLLEVRTAVKTLSMRVEKDGKMKEKNEVAKALYKMSELIMELTSGLSTLGVRSQNVVDFYLGLGERTIKDLKHARQLNATLSASSGLRRWLAPLLIGQTEDAIKQIFLSTTRAISYWIPDLIKCAAHNEGTLKDLETQLEIIKLFTDDDLKNSPEFGVLDGLFRKYVKPSDYQRYQSHRDLLADLQEFFSTSSRQLRATSVALMSVKAYLDELQDKAMKPGVFWVGLPVDEIVFIFEQSNGRFTNVLREIDGRKTIEISAS